jgi:hypothetical protein
MSVPFPLFICSLPEESLIEYCDPYGVLIITQNSGGACELSFMKCGADPTFRHDAGFGSGRYPLRRQDFVATSSSASRWFG